MRGPHGTAQPVSRLDPVPFPLSPRSHSRLASRRACGGGTARVSPEAHEPRRLRPRHVARRIARCKRRCVVHQSHAASHEGATQRNGAVHGFGGASRRCTERGFASSTAHANGRCGARTVGTATPSAFADGMRRVGAPALGGASPAARDRAFAAFPPFERCIRRASAELCLASRTRSGAKTHVMRCCGLRPYSCRGSSWAAGLSCGGRAVRPATRALCVLVCSFVRLFVLVGARAIATSHRSAA